MSRKIRWLFTFVELTEIALFAQSAHSVRVFGTSYIRRSLALPPGPGRGLDGRLSSSVTLFEKCFDFGSGFKAGASELRSVIRALEFPCAQCPRLERFSPDLGQRWLSIPTAYDPSRCRSYAITRVLPSGQSTHLKLSEGVGNLVWKGGVSGPSGAAKVEPGSGPGASGVAKVATGSG